MVCNGALRAATRYMRRVSRFAMGIYDGMQLNRTVRGKKYTMTFADLFSNDAEPLRNPDQGAGTSVLERP